MKLALLVLTLTGSVIFTSSPAQAHTELISQTPAAGSTIATAPESIELNFAEDLLSLGKGNQLQVLDPEGNEVTTGDVVISGASMSRSITGAVALGDYHVSYRAVSADGHVVAGESEFTIGGESTESPSASAVQKSENSKPSQLPKILFYAGGALVIGVILLWIYRRNPITSR